MPTDFGVETIHLDLPALAGALSRRLHDAGLPASAERAASFAHALTLTRPVARRRLYWTTRAVFVTDHTQVKAFDSVFDSVFGRHAASAGSDEPEGHDVRPVTDSDDGGAERRPGSASAPVGTEETPRTRRRRRSDRPTSHASARSRWRSPRATRRCCGASASTRSRATSSRTCTG